MKHSQREGSPDSFMRASGDLERELFQLRTQLELKDRELKESLLQLQAIHGSRSFQFLMRCWSIRRRWLPEGTFRDRAYRIIVSGVGELFRNPVGAAWMLFSHIKWRLGVGLSRKAVEQRLYEKWIASHEPAVEDMAGIAKEAETLPLRPLISLILPGMGHKVACVNAAIRSVQEQAYSNWELWVAADVSAANTGKADGLAGGDGRIHFVNCGKVEPPGNIVPRALESAKGEFVGILDPSDRLAPFALAEVAQLLNRDTSVDFVYFDEDRLSASRRSEPFFKPEFSPHLLMGMNYIGSFFLASRHLIAGLGPFPANPGWEDRFDLVLRISERAKKVAHVPKVLYHREGNHGFLTANAPAHKKALSQALSRRGLEGTVSELSLPGTYRICYRLSGSPLISIIIPTKNKIALLKQCLKSIEDKTSYKNYEILVVDNGSTETPSRRYLDLLRQTGKCRVLDFGQPFNYSKLNNFGVQHSRGELLVFLNNDTAVITPDWLEEMAGYAQQGGIGAVGAKLLYRNSRVQHGGIVLGVGDVAGHAFYGMRSSEFRYMGLASVARDCSAVTAACLMIRRSVFEEAGGFDEGLTVAYNDVDLCLRLRERGYANVYTPHATLYHFEGRTRGDRTPYQDTHLFRSRWGALVEKGDPYYSPNLTRDAALFRLAARLE